MTGPGADGPSDDEQFDAVADDLGPRVSTGRMFGSRALRVSATGKVLACLRPDGAFVAKLGAGTAAHTEALAVEGAVPFDPSGKRRPMKDWVWLPPGEQDRWLRFATAALALQQR